MSIRGFGLIRLKLESPCDCGIELPGTISHGVSYLLKRLPLWQNHYLVRRGPGSDPRHSGSVLTRNGGGFEWLLICVGNPAVGCQQRLGGLHTSSLNRLDDFSPLSGNKW